MHPLPGRLVVAQFSFTAEGPDPDGPHAAEEWRLEFFPIGGEHNSLLALEDAIFLSYRRNYSVKGALENDLLNASEEDKEAKVIEMVGTHFRGQPQYYLKIEDSLFIPTTPPAVDLPIDIPIVPYARLELGPPHNPAGGLYSIVKVKGKLYIYKVAGLPTRATRYSQELRNYSLLKESSWIAELGGKVCRQGRNEGFLIHYYEKGDLT
jgi:hypothetical protein